MITNTEKITKYKKIIEKHISNVQDQIFYENSFFILTLRKILEGILYFEYDYNSSEITFLTNEEIKNKYSSSLKEDGDNLTKEIAKLTGTLSELFLHFSINEENNSTILKADLKAIILKINEIISKSTLNTIDEIPNIPKATYSNDVELKIPVEMLNEYNLNEFLDISYKIPDYQRSFNWTNKKIINMIEWIDKGGKLDLGIFYRTDNQELIDGQQRLHSIFIIYKIISCFFKDDFFNNDEKALEMNKLITRHDKRRGEEFKNNFSKLIEELLISNKKDTNFNEIYNKLNSIEKKKLFFNKFKSMKVNFKKIEHKLGIQYFNKINNEGLGLSYFENVITVLLNEESSIGNKEKYYDLWNDYDSKSKDEVAFIDELINQTREKLEENNDFKFTAYFLDFIINKHTDIWYLKIYENELPKLSTEENKDIFNEIFIRYKEKDKSECVKLLILFYLSDKLKLKDYKNWNLNDLIEKNNFNIKKQFYIYSIQLFLLNLNFEYGKLWKKFENEFYLKNHFPKISEYDFEIIKKIRDDSTYFNLENGVLQRGSFPRLQRMNDDNKIIVDDIIMVHDFLLLFKKFVNNELSLELPFFDILLSSKEKRIKQEYKNYISGKDIQIFKEDIVKYVEENKPFSKEWFIKNDNPNFEASLSYVLAESRDFFSLFNKYFQYQFLSNFNYQNKKFACENKFIITNYDEFTKERFEEFLNELLKVS